MPHIHTGEGEHDFTASAYIFKKYGDEYKLLLHEHVKLGKFMNFGGHVELNETPWSCIVKEIREESGYDISQLTVLQPKVRIAKLTNAVIHPQPLSVATYTYHAEKKHYHSDVCYAFIASGKPLHKMQEGESTNFLELTREELIDLPKDTTFEDNVDTGLHIFDQILGKWQEIDPSVYKTSSE